MGCDIHTRAERKVNGEWEVIPGLHPFDWRSYGMFGFLANVRNYSAVPPLSNPRGLPDDCEIESDWELGEHSFSWLSVHELLAFDYNLPLEDRRVKRQAGTNSWDGGCTCDPGEGEQTTYREFLGKAFFDDLEKLKEAGAERVVFGFDS